MDKLLRRILCKKVLKGLYDKARSLARDLSVFDVRLV